MSQDTERSKFMPDTDNTKEVQDAEKSGSTQDAEKSGSAQNAETSGSKAEIIHDGPGRQVDAAAIEKDPRHAAPREDLKTEDNLELSALSLRERRKIRRERFKTDMEGMNKKEKLSHFLTYNMKKTALCLLIIFLVAAIAFTVIKNKRPTVLSYVIVNSPDQYSMDTETMEKNYMEYYGFTDRQKIESTSPVSMDLETFDANYNAHPNDEVYTTFPVYCANNFYDIIISDKKGVECCADRTRIYPLSEVLSDELYEIISGDEYKDRILCVKDGYGYVEEFAIDISDTEFAKTLNTGYDDVYICFPGTSENNRINVERVLNYIFDLGLDINTEEK